MRLHIGSPMSAILARLAQRAVWAIPVLVTLGLGCHVAAAAVGFSSPALFDTGDQPLAIAIGDFNHDAVNDLAVADFANDRISILLGNPDGTFESAINESVTTPKSVVVGDFNHDGNLDIAAVQNKANSVVVLLGNGDGTFGVFQFSATGPNPNALVTGDFNRDGKIDVAIALTGGNVGGIVGEW
jgi:hypothetical protein